MNRQLLVLEIGGGAFIAAGAAFMRRLFALNNGMLLGILFGAVNGSDWEQTKTLLLPYALWALLEVLLLRLRFHRFTVAKTAALYALGVVSLLLRLVGLQGLFADILSVAAALGLSCFLYGSPLPLRWLFAPSLVLLFLFVSLYVSLTPFPPRFVSFYDSATGLYGIVPPYFDYGAAALDALNNL